MKWYYKLIILLVVLHTIYVNLGIEFHRSVMQYESKSVEQSKKLGVFLNEYKVVSDSTKFLTTDSFLIKRLKMVEKSEVWSEHRWMYEYSFLMFSKIKAYPRTQVVLVLPEFLIDEDFDDEYVIASPFFKNKSQRFDEVDYEQSKPYVTKINEEQSIRFMIWPDLPPRTKHSKSRFSGRTIPDTCFIEVGLEKNPRFPIQNEYSKIAVFMFVKVK